MLFWTVVWLGGTSAISAWSANRHGPALEQLFHDDVAKAVASASDSTIGISIVDHTALLDGDIDSDDERIAIMTAARSSLGIRDVQDRLQLRPAADDTTRPALTAESVEVAEVTEPADTPETGALANNRGPEGVDPAGDTPSQLAGDDTQETDSNTVALNAGSAADELDVEDTSIQDSITAADEIDVEDTSIQDSITAADELDVEDTAIQDNIDAIADVDVIAETAVDAAPDAPIESDVPELDPPSLTLALADGVLTLDGSLASFEDSLTLVDIAVDSFDLDYVSNSVETDAPVGDADWMQSVNEVLPMLSELKNPALAISDRQVVLSGSAADRATRDQIVDTLHERFGDFDVVETIIVASAASGATGTDAGTASRTGTAANIDTTSGEDNENSPDADEDSNRLVDALAVASLGSEANLATDPAPGKSTASPAEALRADWNELEDTHITFDRGGSDLTPDSKLTLDRIARLLTIHPDVHIEIEGHTDSVGNREDNLQLSQRRASAVRDYLIERGIPYDSMSAYGYGESRPVTDNRTRKGRTTNRRIEFTF